MEKSLWIEGNNAGGRFVNALQDLFLMQSLLKGFLQIPALDCLKVIMRLQLHRKQVKQMLHHGIISSI